VTRHRTLEILVKETLEVEPRAAEREAVWQSIAAQLSEEMRPRSTAMAELVRRRPRRRRRPRAGRVMAAATAALAIGLVTLTLLSSSDKSGTLLLATSEARAAAILNTTANHARVGVPAVGPGQYLFAQTSSAVTGEGAIRVDSKSWTATDGSAWIVDHQRSSRGVETSTTRYVAGGDVALDTVDGVTTRRTPKLGGWRAVVAGYEVVKLTSDRDALLVTLRAGVDRAVRQLQAIAERPPREQPGGVRTHYPGLDQVELWGRDLFVVETVTQLLMWAPLSPDQRATLLSLLANIPQWYQPGTSATQAQIRSLGPTKDALGRAGTAVRIAADPAPEQAARTGSWLVDFVLDQDAGRVLETRSYEHGPNAEPVRGTVKTQRVVDDIPR
jgi:hypothetical protein